MIHHQLANNIWSNKLEIYLRSDTKFNLAKSFCQLINQHSSEVMRFRNSYQRIPSSLDGDADDETQHGTNWLRRIVLICSIVSIVALVAFGLAYLLIQPSSSTEKLFSQTSFSNDSISSSLTKTNSTNSTTNQFKSSNCSSMTCCKSGSCERFKRSLFSHMDLSADPCNDFHQYVCGKMKDESDSISNEMLSTLKKIGSVLKSTESSSLSTKSKAVQYVMDLAKEHDDEDAREQLGAEPIRVLLSQVLGNERWPMLRPNLSFNSARTTNNLTNEIEAAFDHFWNQLSEHDSIKKSIHSAQFEAFAQFWKSWKLWEKSKKDLDEPDDPLDTVHQWMECHVEASMVDVHSLIDDLLTFDSKTWKYQVSHIVLSQDYVNESDYAQLFADYQEHKKGISLLFALKQWNATLDSALFEVMHFNRELSRILKASESIAYFDFTPNNSKAITLRELKLYSSEAFDWTLLLNKLASRAGETNFRYTDEDTVHVAIGQIGEFKPFTELIARTPIRVLKNRIAFKVIRDKRIRELLDPKHRIVVEEEKEKGLLDDLLGMIDNWAAKLVLPGVRFLLNTIEFEVFKPIYARLHLDIVGRERMRFTRQQVTELVDRLKQSFRDSLKNEHHWLDEQTRQNALKKLDSMKTLIGFPDWIFDDGTLDEEYGFTSNATSNIASQQPIKGHYAASFFNLIRLSRASALRRAYQQNRQSDRVFPFIFHNAGYIPSLNSFVTSYTFLSEPLYHENYPLAINYANLGMVAAHEITHGFDNEGRLYDAEGLKTDWWTNSTVAHFEHLSKCFVDKYDGLVESVTGVKINGTVKLPENIADFGGVRHAYRAFEASLQHSDDCGQKLCDSNFFGFTTTKFTPQQLFFISYSKNWCSIHKNSTELVDATRNDPHSPGRFRINVPLANMDQFSRAFNCPVGSKMNPQDKCSLW